MKLRTRPLNEDYTHLVALPADFAPRPVPLRDLAPPRPREIHLWFVDLDEMAGALRTALGGTAPEEGHGAYSGGQLTFTRRFYLRLLLGAYLEIPGKKVRIVRNRRGKPVLDPERHGRGLHFSIAKSGYGFLVGVSSSDYLGVDIEPVDRKPRSGLGIARRYFSPRESAALEAMGADGFDRAFLRTWSCKEAVVKAMGLGIANQLCRFTVETDPERPPAVLEFEGDDPRAWWLRMIVPDPSFVGAVATRSEPAGLSAFRMLPAPAGA